MGRVTTEVTEKNVEELNKIIVAGATTSVSPRCLLTSVGRLAGMRV